MTFEPEKVTSYELGWKGSFFDKRSYAGVALFHAKYKDMQIPASVGCVVGGGPKLLRPHQQRRQGADPGCRVRRQCASCSAIPADSA